MRADRRFGRGDRASIPPTSVFGPGIHPFVGAKRDVQSLSLRTVSVVGARARRTGTPVRGAGDLGFRRQANSDWKNVMMASAPSRSQLNAERTVSADSVGRETRRKSTSATAPNISTFFRPGDMASTRFLLGVTAR